MINLSQSRGLAISASWLSDYIRTLLLLLSHSFSFPITRSHFITACSRAQKEREGMPTRDSGYVTCGQGAALCGSVALATLSVDLADLHVLFSLKVFEFCTQLLLAFAPCTHTMLGPA